ncbi:hypothetical protein N8I74_10940 [Chitiniphilus purpureus]|uniref:Uncharacterized protein n=1 Tax=Chitiniphilus purpureus TaxID=2981137 RepID=A0ABY6DJG4_9NEIS|nr:hypothetical protein [Chitiniphilus sp. CD1]UXY13838.1 hypothetical protein N8I74_10940 [Chitiniphilus sp. CD1]
MRSATDMLRDIAGGELVEHFGDAIRELNHAITACDDKKGGSITLKINIKPAGRGSGALNVDYDFTIRAPKLPRRSSIMFGTPEGDMLATDPTQRQLDLRQVETTPAAAVPLRDANAGTTELRTA